MSTPFDNTPAALVVPATDGQLGFITALLNDRDMSLAASTRPKFVARATALRLVITWAYAPMADDTPPAISRVLNNTVGRNSSYGERVNALLAHLAADHDDASLYTPLTKRAASGLIDWLTTLPQHDRVAMVKAASQRTEDFADVPAGRYAVATNDGAINELAFYQVDRPDTGKWAGYVFVKHLVGDDEQRLSRAAGAAILAKISAVGAEAASAAYGHEIGECGVCGRTLTNDESRARGIGPVCIENMGW